MRKTTRGPRDRIGPARRGGSAARTRGGPTATPRQRVAERPRIGRLHAPAEQRIAERLPITARQRLARPTEAEWNPPGDVPPPSGPPEWPPEPPATPPPRPDEVPVEEPGEVPGDEPEEAPDG